MVSLIDMIGHWSTRINALTFLLLLILFIGGMITWETLKEKVQAFFAIFGM